MKIAKWIAFVFIFVMAGGIAYAFIFGDFAQEGSRILSMPWGVVSLIDLYTGFSLFSLWIYYREKSIPRSLVWIFFMMTLGFLTASVYVFLAFQSSQGSWQHFFHGKTARVN